MFFGFSAPKIGGVLTKTFSKGSFTRFFRNEVVDEYVKVLGVETVAGTGIWVLDRALSVNETKACRLSPRIVAR